MYFSRLACKTSKRLFGAVYQSEALFLLTCIRQPYSGPACTAEDAPKVADFQVNLERSHKNLRIPFCVFVLDHQFIISAVTAAAVIAFPGARQRVRQTYNPT